MMSGFGFEYSVVYAYLCVAYLCVSINHKKSNEIKIFIQAAQPNIKLRHIHDIDVGNIKTLLNIFYEVRLVAEN